MTTSSPQAPPPPPTTCTVLDRSLQRERIKKGLEHMRNGLAKRDWQNMLTRYEGLPDSYDLMAEAKGPKEFVDRRSFQQLAAGTGKPAAFWELMAGSGGLSAAARSNGAIALASD